MWVSRIPSLGAQSLKKLAQGLAPRTSYLYASAGSIQSLSRPLRHQYFCSAATSNSSIDGNERTQLVNVTFVERDGQEVHVEVPVGTTMLEAAHAYDIDLEGACEGSCACSTCHVIVMDVSYYNKLPEPTEEENDMLYLALELTETSRLGCQIKATPEIDGIRFALPSATRNFAVDRWI